MGITAITRDWGNNPSIVRVVTTDSQATVAGAGYLTAQIPNITLANSGTWQWLADDLVLVAASDVPPNTDKFYNLSADFSSLTLYSTAGNGGVTLPVVSNDFAVFDGTSGALKDNGYSPSDPSKTKVVMAGSAVVVGTIAKFVDTAGTIDDTAGAVVNQGNIQAGSSGVAGEFISFPSAAASGSLIYAAVANAGNFNVTVSNASHGQASVYSIPDGGQSTSNFLISNSAGTQHIATGNLQLDVGTLSLGSSGHPSSLILFPATAANGTLILAPVNAGGAFNTTISNGAMGQSTVYTLPDIGASTGDIVVSTAAVRMKSVDAAAAAGGNAAQSFTDTFCTSTSVVIGNWVTQTTPVEVIKIVPGNGSFVVTSTGDAGVGTFSYVILK